MGKGYTFISFLLSIAILIAMLFCVFQLGTITERLNEFERLEETTRNCEAICLEDAKSLGLGDLEAEFYQVSCSNGCNINAVLFVEAMER